MRKINFLAIIIASSILFFGMSGEAFAVYWADSIYGSYDSDDGFGGGLDKDGDGYYEWWEGDRVYGSNVNPDVALGEPDESFVSILPDEYITVSFSVPFINGPGNDFFVAETGHAGEEAEIYVSFNETTFTSLGKAEIPNTGYCTYDPNSIDFGDYYWFDLGGFTQPVHYVKITGVKACGASEGFDLTGVGAEYPIPEPATMLLLGSGLLGLAALGRKRKGFLS